MVDDSTNYYSYTFRHIDICYDRHPGKPVYIYAVLTARLFPFVFFVRHSTLRGCFVSPNAALLTYEYYANETA